MKGQQLRILQHSLGLDRYGNGVQYRNHYCAGNDDVAICRELASMGYMEEREPSQLTGGAPLFLVTEAGINAVALESPPPPKLTRGQRRYNAYLESECLESFGEWLKNPYWNDLRKRRCC